MFRAIRSHIVTFLTTISLVALASACSTEHKGRVYTDKEGHKYTRSHVVDKSRQGNDDFIWWLYVDGGSTGQSGWVQTVPPTSNLMPTSQIVIQNEELPTTSFMESTSSTGVIDASTTESAIEAGGFDFGGADSGGADSGGADSGGADGGGGGEGDNYIG